MRQANGQVIGKQAKLDRAKETKQDTVKALIKTDKDKTGQTLRITLKHINETRPCKMCLPDWVI